MATTLNVSLSANAEFNNFKDFINPGSLTVTLNAQGASIGIQAIGTSAENVNYGELTTAQVGWCFLRNHDTTNFITYGQSNAGTLQPIGKLLPGEFAFFRLKHSEQLMALADTAACNLEHRIYRN